MKSSTRKKLAWDEVTEQDSKILCTQMGKAPKGVLGIACRCKYGYPQVIVNRPVRVEEEEVNVFPTLFWLTCPYLKTEVSRLESMGLIGEYQEELENSPELAEEMERVHKGYAQVRLGLVPTKVQGKLKDVYPALYKVLEETGVGGIRGNEGIKCLHTHLADYLIRKDNVIGQRVYDLLNGEMNCDSANCAKELE